MARCALRFLTPIPALYRGFTLHPDDDADPEVFRVDMSGLGGGSLRVVFGRDKGTGRGVLHLDLMPVIAPEAAGANEPAQMGHRSARCGCSRRGVHCGAA